MPILVYSSLHFDMYIYLCPDPDIKHAQFFSPLSISSPL